MKHVWPCHDDDRPHPLLASKLGIRSTAGGKLASHLRSCDQRNRPHLDGQRINTPPATTIPS
ncbi:uncharacterized protein BDZ83DRAFT_207010 [Colletotrichum acutatum]|uniref:Uncharacterized protein n=1 Tax=Glomerella acutata TaxID=27357 RepID=A0AAD8XJT1_GLOAC|nr:uncharacterized protein BDZ83DRAFT_207010 [Colletotrichum acutatum]KAK1727500.1 hypothetical protein BDZ83DRAFT_207010 [Colletotrichum acutatum]